MVELMKLIIYFLVLVTFVFSFFGGNKRNNMTIFCFVFVCYCNLILLRKEEKNTIFSSFW